MSDQSTVYGYLTAFHAHHAAVEKVEELATLLAVLAKGLLDWKTTATAAASRLPSLAEWPSAEQLVKHLEACAAPLPGLARPMTGGGASRAILPIRPRVQKAGAMDSMRKLLAVGFAVLAAGCGKDEVIRDKPISQWRQALQDQDAKVRRQAADA